MSDSKEAKSSTSESQASGSDASVPAKASVSEVVAVRKLLSPRALMLIGAAAVLVLFGLLSWSNGRQVRAAKEEGLVRCSNALAASFAQTLIDRNPARALNSVVSVAKDAGFEEVTLTDPAGNIVVSTNKSKINASIVLPDKPLLTPKVTRDGSRVTVLRAVAVGGDNVVGALRLVLKDAN